MCARPSGCQGAGETTAQHTAAYYGDLDMVCALVKGGADVNLSLEKQHAVLSSALDRKAAVKATTDRSISGAWYLAFGSEQLYIYW